MRILFCCFSATGNTATMGQAISRRLGELGAEVDWRDITTPEGRKAPVDMASYDAAVFGTPIHSMRSPRVAREWLAGLDGQGKKCATYFTFGGFQVHPTHSTTQKILREAGFAVAASAEFPGAHTFNLGGWQVMTDRPNQADLAVAVEYAQAIFDRFSGQDAGVVGDLDPGAYSEEQLDQFEMLRYKAVSQLPTRQGAECQLCYLCQEQCPTGAMDAEAGQVTEPSLCIACLRCVKDCPDQALKVNDLTPLLAMKMKNDNETDDTLRAKQSKMYL